MEEHHKQALHLVKENASLEERVGFFKTVAPGYLEQKKIKELYILWNKTFDDSFPILWLPGEKEMRGNLGRMLQENKFNKFSQLHAWSVQNRDAFWEETVKKLKIAFKRPYDSVLELVPSVEDPTWFKNAELNIADSCFLAPEEKTAIIQKDEAGNIEKISYGKLNKLAQEIASGLKQAGYQKGDNIIFYLPLTIESVASYLAVVMSGMRVVSVADSFSPSELKKRAEMTGAKAIFTCDSYKYGGKQINVFEKVKEAGVRNAIILQIKNSERELRDGDCYLKDLLQQEKFNSVPCTPQEVSNILFSSGTTKEPKAIPWTHITPFKCAADGYYHHDIHPEDVVTWTTGMGWMMAPWLIYASLINKATMALYVGAATGEDFGHFVKEAGITILGTIPSVVKGWIRNDFINKFRWKLKLFSSTGEPSGKEDYFYLMALAGFEAPVIEYCGGTEIGGGYITGTIVQPASPASFTTAALGLDFILLKEDHSVAEENETGEVYLLPPSVGLTQTLLNKNHHEEYYAGNPSGPNGETLRKHGDAFEKVISFGHTFLKSTGRTDDAMNLGGIKVSAIEIEEVLNTVPGVLETAAISIPTQDQGPEKLVIFYVSRVEQTLPYEELLKTFQTKLSSELNPLFRVSEIIAAETLPRTASNKIMRRELRKTLKK